MNELERTKAALGFLLDKLDRRINERMAMPDRELLALAQQAREILNPPVYEDVELTRWECDVCGRVFTHDIISGLVCGNMTDGTESCGSVSYTRLTGTRRVEKPQPRERSVSVEGRVSAGEGPELRGDVFVAAVHAPFLNYPETHGKTGVLTFTWPE